MAASADLHALSATAISKIGEIVVDASARDALVANVTRALVAATTPEAAAGFASAMATISEATDELTIQRAVSALATASPAAAAAGAGGRGASPVVADVELANGVKIPALGFGCAFGNWTDQSRPMRFEPELGWSAITSALKVGYRHFDGALIYNSHRVLASCLGRKFSDGSLKREDVFITTKIAHPAVPLGFNTLGHTVDAAREGVDLKAEMRQAIERSLEQLSVGHVDLLLMHWPGAMGSTDEAANRTARKEIWEAMEEALQTGRARAIGVSNFLVRHLETMIEDTTVVPMVNQIEVNPYIQQREVVEYCQSKGIVVEAWAPFGSGATGVLTDPAVLRAAEAHGKNAGQVILRWLTQKGLVALPKSSNERRMAGNLDVFDFELSAEEVAAIDALDRGKTSVATADSIP